MNWPDTHRAVHTMPAMAITKNIPVSPDRPKLNNTTAEMMMVSMVMPDAAILVLLYLGGRQRHCHYGQQACIRHDHAHHHHLRSCVVELWPVGGYGYVLRDGHCGHGVHGSVRIGPVHHRSESRLLAWLNAGRGGEGEVYRRYRRCHHRRLDDYSAGPRLSVWRSRAGRHATDSGGAAGIHHEGACRSEE